MRARYHARAVEGRRFYGMIDLFGDERVRTYIRYGPPHREVFEPRVIRSDTVRITISPAEIWTYDSLGLQIDFVKTGIPYEVVGTSRFGPNVTMPALEPLDLDLPAPKPAEDARPLDLQLALYRLRQESDSVEVEIQYGIPLAEIAQAFPTGTQPRFCVRINLEPRARGEARTILRWVGCPQARDSGIAPRAVALERMNLPADIYRVTVEVTAGNGAAFGSRTAELNLIEYVRRAQPASDVVFYSLVDSTFQSPQFRQSGWQRLVPLCGRQVTTGSTCYVMYELYNLTPDSAGNHHIEADYDFIEESTRQLTFPATPRRFVTGEGTTARVVERIHTMNLRPGTYLVVARVRDTESGNKVSLTTELQIIPR